MKKTEMINKNKWKQYLEYRKKEVHLWTINPIVKKYCNFKDKQNRYIRIAFEYNHNFKDIESQFHITSGKEISFNVEYQNIIPILITKVTIFFVAPHYVHCFSSFQ